MNQTNFMNLEWYLGTIGFGYKDWRGVFYPESMPSRNYLAYYSEYFNAVELDTTFYGPPDDTRVAAWAAAVSPQFQVSPKTPRAITHELRLTNAQSAMQQFLAPLHRFGPRLGPILIQLPPDFTAAEALTLDHFLEALPTGLRFAVELRHKSWYQGPAAKILSRHRVAWVSHHIPNLPQQINHTADFIYIRWMGQHGQYPQHTRERADRSDDLTWWWQALQPYLNRVDQVYGYMNNDYAGYAPDTCNRFKQIAGLPVQRPQIFRQQSLF